MKFATPLLRVILLSALIGCQAADDPQVLAMRERYRLSTEPSGAAGILHVREQLLESAGLSAASTVSPKDSADQVTQQSDANDNVASAQPTPVGPTASQPVVLVGRIGGGANPTWESGRAVFVMMDPAAELGEHGHGGPGHDDNCPFCRAAKKNAVDASAFVQFVDDAGAVVPIDARKLLAVQEGQLVVVQGSGMIDELGNLVVNASGVYPRQ